MKRMVRNWTMAVLFVAVLGGTTVSVALPQTTFAASSCSSTLLTFPAWYQGLQRPDCSIKSPSELKTNADPTGLSTFIWKIVLNIIELLLQLTGYVSVVFIMVGGFKLLTGTGTPDTVAKARTTILNAVIGLIISIFSVAIVKVVADTLI
jgi:type IV secretion system pilin